jgi:hypothetical protein
MKDPLKLQEKLIEILKKHPKLKLTFRVPCSDLRLRELAGVVRDFVDNSGDVTNDDPLHEWLEEYHFYHQETFTRRP